MSEKDCGHHSRHKHKRLRRILIGLLILIILVLLTVLITWAVLHPKKPRFILQDVTVFSFNLTAPNVLSSVLQVTVISYNPNRRIGVYYDRLNVHASYRGQQITYPTSVPDTFQDTRSTDIWSPFLYGQLVPIAPITGARLSSDGSRGAVPLDLKMDGRVRWKVGAFTSGPFRIHVHCPVVINSGNPAAGTTAPNKGVKYQSGNRCRVVV